MRAILYQNDINWADVLINEFYSQVSSKTFLIGDAMKGIYSYIPLDFGESFNSLLSTSVHCWVSNLSMFNKPKMTINLKEHWFRNTKCKIKAFRMISNQNSCDLLDYSEEDVWNNWYSYNDYSLWEYYFGKMLNKNDQINETDAYNLYLLRCKLIADHYNSLRFAFIQLYSYLFKINDKLSSIGK